MPLAGWIDRNFGQFLAPDENYDPNPDNVDTKSPARSYAAPYPNCDVEHLKKAGAMATASADVASTPVEGKDAAADMVVAVSADDTTEVAGLKQEILRLKEVVATKEKENLKLQAVSKRPLENLNDKYIVALQECKVELKEKQNKIEILESRSTSERTAQRKERLLPFTPETKTRQHQSGDTCDYLRSRVLSAAIDTAMTHCAPKSKKDASFSMFRACSSKNPSAKSAHQMEKMFKDDADLLKVRSVGSCWNTPEGFTPLMAAAYRGNEKAAASIWNQLSSSDEQAEQLLAVSLIGKSVFHIACEMGHKGMLSFLTEKYREVFGVATPLPRDLTGRTPLGALLTSPVPQAKKNKNSLRAFFSPDDPCIIGDPAPAEDRCKTDAALQVSFGHAEMPGMRVLMEDSLVAEFRHEPVPMGFFGVFDGHSDDGQVSAFVAKHLPNIMIDKKLKKNGVVWKDCCREAFLTVDQQLKSKNLPGGSTAVVALVTQSQIIVANAGDSRCILVQCNDVEATSTVDVGMKQLSLSEKAKTPWPSLQRRRLEADDLALFHDRLESLSLWNDPVTKALSRDHKPCLQEEKERAEQAGLIVFEDEFKDEKGETQVISKIRLSESDFVAVSRAFGDFAYKECDAPPEKQPIVAIPEVIVHDRDPEKDQFLILACDGVWDVMTNDDVANFVVDQISQELSGIPVANEAAILPTIGDRLLKECLNRGSEDNMTVVVVALSKVALKLSRGGGKRRLNFIDEATAPSDSS